MNKFLSSGLVISAIISLVGCGGGGGGDTTAALSEPLIEYDLRTFIDKSSLTLNFDGMVADTEIQATLYITYEGTVDYMGTTLDLHQEVAVVNGTTSTSYLGTYLGNPYGMILDNGTECYIAEGVTPTPIPTNATIGYVSDIVLLECNEGSKIEMSVKLEVGDGDNAIAVTTTKEYNEFGNLEYESESYATFDPDMNLVAYGIKIEDSILQATSITQD